MILMIINSPLLKALEVTSTSGGNLVNHVCTSTSVFPKSASRGLISRASFLE